MSTDLPPGSVDDAAAERRAAWRLVVSFGVIALLGDVLYQGARSITGPLLADLGATALVVGLVTGVGEASALALRLVSGRLADATKRYWAWAIAGYALTAITVPFLGYASVLWVAAALIILERIGKAIRSPAKDTLLSYAAATTGRGKGFAVHKALDQFGAVTGPLVVAAVLALTGNAYGPALAVLALPAVLLMALLVRLAIRVPHPERFEPALARAADARPDPEAESAGRLAGLSPALRWYAGFAALTMTGFATFGVVSYHLVVRGLVAPAWVPVLYAAGMLTAAAGALLTGWGYDRWGPRVLVILPVAAALTPVLAFSDAVWPAVVGAVLWGGVLGVHESTLKATVADLTATSRRATAYGLFGAVVGVAVAVGGAGSGFLYEISIPLLIAVTVAIQAIAAAVLWRTLRVMAAGAASPVAG